MIEKGDLGPQELTIHLEDAKMYKGIDLIIISMFRQFDNITMSDLVLWTHSTRQGVIKSLERLGITYDGKYYVF